MKKVFAREFLLLLITCLIGAFTYLFIFIYNGVISNKMEKQKEQIFKIEKQYDGLRTDNKLRKILIDAQKRGMSKEQMDDLIVAFEKKYGKTSTPKSFEVNEEANHNLSLKERELVYEIKSEKEKLQKINHQFFSSESQFKLSIKVFFILLIILFPIRYIYYLTKWSVKTLKE